MDSTESVSNQINETQVMPLETNGQASIVPMWINEDLFVDILEENVDGFKKILNFDARPAGGGGENYASLMLRIKVEVELEDGSTKDIVFMMKTPLQGEQAMMMLNSLGLFPKEQAMYGILLPEFEQMYRAVGKGINFGPKFFRFKNDPETKYILMEDLAPHGFKNVNRLEGLDREHTESVLRLLAKLHAASAVRYETKGDYKEPFSTAVFAEKNREFFETMNKALHASLLESLAGHKTTSKYVEKIKKIQEALADLFIKLPDNTEFNVIIHGDLWANNIMFRHNEKGKLEETVFVDFQASRFVPPVVDLIYFLLSSTKLELKLSQFDNFVKYYFDHLTENLKLLSYPKKLPTLKELHMQMLRHSFWGVAIISGVMAAVLLDPTEGASFDTFLGEGEAGKQFQMKMYDNPRYIKHMEAILPWLDTRGFLD